MEPLRPGTAAPTDSSLSHGIFGENGAGILEAYRASKACKTWMLWGLFIPVLPILGFIRLGKYVSEAQAAGFHDIAGLRTRCQRLLVIGILGGLLGTVAAKTLLGSFTGTKSSAVSSRKASL